MTTATKRRLTLALWLLALWTSIALLFATQWHTYDSLYGKTWPWNQYLRWAFEQWCPWAALSPLVLWLAQKRPIVPRRLLQTIPLHIAAGALVALLAICMQAVLSHLFNTEKFPVSHYITLYLSKDAAICVATYWGLTGLAQTLSYYKENTSRRLRETQLERQLVQAQLQVLQMQLHPHFLFNTLHAIGTLIHEDPVAAEQMLLDLSGLLRVFLERQSSQQISLQRELHLVALYLNIQRIRFRDRLQVRSGIASEALDCAVPSLILQPIVENAIVHGIAKHPGEDTIEIAGWVQDDMLVLEIRNSNSILPATAGAAEHGSGVGLSITRQRLEQMYNGAAALTLSSRMPRGVTCRMVMPFVRAVSVLRAEEELLSL